MYSFADRLRRLALGTAAAGFGLGLAVDLAGASAYAQAPVAAAAAIAPRADPALWVVRDADSTIYLFGTVHVLKDGTSWRAPKIDAALRDSQELYLEIAEMGDSAAAQAAATPLIQRLGLDAARPLSSKLSPEDRGRLSAVAPKIGLNPAQLELMRPWLAAVTLSVVPLLQAGFDPELGVDTLVAKAATAQGKPIRGFETTEQQLRFFADLPLAVEVQLLHEALDDIDGAPVVLTELSEAWARGDTATFERLFLAEMRQDSPELYKVLIVDRNEAWAKAIAERLKGSGVSFIAVGAGHLTGPDSVQAKLAARGVKTERR